MKKEDEDILFFAFRYALGRRTWAVGMMVDVLKTKWEKISDKTRTQIKGEIQHAIDLGHAGAEPDIEDWKEILELPSGDYKLR